MQKKKPANGGLLCLQANGRLMISSLPPSADPGWLDFSFGRTCTG
jgi:hypothetical protein